MSAWFSADPTHPQGPLFLVSHEEQGSSGASCGGSWGSRACTLGGPTSSLLLPTSSSHPFLISSVIVLCTLGCCAGIRGANEGAKAKATPLTIQGGLEEGWQRGKIPGSCLLRALIHPDHPSFACPQD